MISVDDAGLEQIGQQRVAKLRGRRALQVLDLDRDRFLDQGGQLTPVGRPGLGAHHDRPEHGVGEILDEVAGVAAQGDGNPVV